MIYIVEGSNKVGKTTGIEQILKRDDSRKKITINNRYVNDMMEDRRHDSAISAYSMLDFIKELSIVEDLDVYIDRFHLSELVYGKLNRKYTNHSMYTIDEHLSKINNLKLVLITCNDYSHVEDKMKVSEYLEVQTNMKFAFNESMIKNKVIVTSDKFVKGEVPW